MTIISGNTFTDQIQVFSIQSDPIRSDPIQVLSTAAHFWMKLWKFSREKLITNINAV